MVKLNSVENGIGDAGRRFPRRVLMVEMSEFTLFIKNCSNLKSHYR